MLARLHERNGHRWLLDALVRLRAACSRDWTCTFAGDGPEEAALRRQVEHLGLTDRVLFAGHCDDAPAFLRSVDVCVHSSVVSGMPNAVLEAMAAGLPVIATSVGGTVEAVEDGETGFLVAPGDADGFVSRAVALLNEPELARTMGARGRRRVEDRFSNDAAVRATSQMLDELAQTEMQLEYRAGLGWRKIT